MSAAREEMSMPSWVLTARFRLVLSCLVFAAGLSLGCSGGGDVVGSGVTASFTGSGTPSAPNVVRLNRVSSSGNLATLEVALGGPTTSTDLYSFAFDVVLGDPSVVEYVNDSATVGTALTSSGGQTFAVDASQSGDHVIVGLTKLGGGSGNGVTASEVNVLRLTFKVLKAGTSTISFSGSTSPSNPSGQPAALASNGVVVASVTFDSNPAAIAGM